MSAATRATVRGKKTTKKTATKAAVKKSVKKIAKKTSKKTSKKVTTQSKPKPAAKKVSKRSTKTSTTKTTKKVLKRTVKRPKNAAPQSVREARFGGHRNTIPNSPKAPGRLLGRSITLGMAGLATTNQFNPDAIAVAIARIGGVGVMIFGAALSWNIFNQLAAVPTPSQTASVITADSAIQPAVTIASEQPIIEPASVVVSIAAAEQIVLTLTQATSTFVLGAANQRTEATWEYRLDPSTVPAGTYTLRALAETPAGYQTIVFTDSVTITQNTPTPVTAGVSPSVPTPNGLATSSATSSQIAATGTRTSLPAVVQDSAPTTTMPTLFAPTIHMLAPASDDTVLVVGEGSPRQPLELLLLREQQRATTTVQANGWWSLEIATPRSGSHYEVYAQASPELLSGPLDFSVISGRLVHNDSETRTQTSLVSESDVSRDALVWYLVVSVGIVSLGTVLLLIGHHLHQLRRREQYERQLDQAA